LVKGFDNFKREKLSAYFVSGGEIKTHNNDKFVRYFGKFRYKKKNGLVMLMEASPENTTEMMSIDWSGSVLNGDLHGGLSNPRFWDKTGIT
jgi:hypothetical protein